MFLLWNVNKVNMALSKTCILTYLPVIVVVQYAENRETSVGT